MTMGKGQTDSALRQLRGLFAAGTATGLTDTELLERYTAKRAESAEAATAAEMAFATLADRHGAMVWGVCHRVLGDTHEAEDAFQATFLILVRKAGSVRVDRSLGRWLYGVAHRVALRARSETEHRRSGIGRVPPTSSDDPVGDAELGELRDAVGEIWGKNPGGVGGIDASYIFGDAVATKKGTTLSVTHNIQGKSVRLVAVDGDGEEFSGEIRSTSGVKDFEQIVVEFDQPPEQIKEFRLQTRPYEEVGIPRITLKRK